MSRAIDKVKPCKTLQDVRREVNALDDVIAQCTEKGIPVISQGENIEGMTAAAALNHTMDGGAMGGYCEMGRLSKDANPIIQIKIAVTKEKTGRRTKNMPLR